MVDVMKRPGEGLKIRPLHFTWIADCSGSMAGDKIQTLNFAVKEALPGMRAAAEENPGAQVLVRTLKFSDGAQWVQPQPTPVEEFRWTDLSAEGLTDMGKALSMVAEQFNMLPPNYKGLTPVLVLLSDGEPTDDFTKGLNALMDQPWGRNAVRLAISIGVTEDNDVLQRFIGHSERKPFSANNPDSLVKAIKWCSSMVLRSVSVPNTSKDKSSTDPSGRIHIPEPPDLDDGDDVW